MIDGQSGWLPSLAKLESATTTTPGIQVSVGQGQSVQEQSRRDRR